MRVFIHRLGLVLALATTILGGGCSDKSGARSLATGMQKLSENDIPGAIRSLQKAAVIRPHDPTVLCNLGIAYAKNGQHAEAIASFRKVTLDYPNDPRPLELIVHSLLALNNPNAARESASLALKLTPESPRLTTLMACVEEKAGNIDLAQKFLTSALQLDKDYAPALYDLGMIYYRQGNRKSLAENLLSRFIEQGGDDPRVQEVKKLLLRSEEAPVIQAENNTLTIQEPSHPKSPVKKEEIAEPPSPPPPPPTPPDITPRHDKRAEALASFKTALLAQREGKTKAAIHYYEQALRIDPTLAQAAYNLGLLYLNGNHNEQAQHAFETAIRGDNRMTKAYLQAGVAAMNQKKNVEALQHLTTLLRFTPTNIEARYLAGVACVNIGRQDAARAHFTAYLKLAPKGPMAGYIRTWMKQQS